MIVYIFVIYTVHIQNASHVKIFEDLRMPLTTKILYCLELPTFFHSFRSDSYWKMIPGDLVSNMDGTVILRHETTLVICHI